MTSKSKRIQNLEERWDEVEYDSTLAHPTGVSVDHWDAKLGTWKYLIRFDSISMLYKTFAANIKALRKRVDSAEQRVDLLETTVKNAAPRSESWSIWQNDEGWNWRVGSYGSATAASLLWDTDAAPKTGTEKTYAKARKRVVEELAAAFFEVPAAAPIASRGAYKPLGDDTDLLSRTDMWSRIIRSASSNA